MHAYIPVVVIAAVLWFWRRDAPDGDGGSDYEGDDEGGGIDDGDLVLVPGMARPLPPLTPLGVPAQTALTPTGVPAQTQPTTGIAPLTPTPTEGASYRIVYGDTLFGIVGRAYGVSPGAQRLALARAVNDAPENAGLRRVPMEPSLFPAGRIAFNPPYQVVYFPVR